MKRSDLKDGEFKDYFGRYIGLAPDTGVVEGLEQGRESFLAFAGSIPEGKFDYRYDEGKWTIKEVVQHLVDTERVFSNRAFHIAREDNSPLNGMSQDNYVESSGANNKSKEQLLNEYDVVRNASLFMFRSLTDDAMLARGIVDGATLSTRAAGYILIGHEIYHQKIIKDRYL